MENKKQLVIVPPMSEPLQKLNEVLQGIAEDENIEISIIDDFKELSQYMGSAGQSLVVLSNAKKCATFLQENRFVVAKYHSKVILLTPKEIPAKTLVKFVKIGLTESILETAPPKTLLYKVKLLLRSIKSTSVQQEEKDQVVKSMLDMNQAASKNEMTFDKDGEEKKDIANNLTEEISKTKTEKEENAIDYGKSLKGKSNYREESIETNWKSKRKAENLDYSYDDSPKKVDEEDSSDIDMYYRGKKKNGPIEVFEENDNMRTKKGPDSEYSEEESYKKQNTNEINLDIEVGRSLDKNKNIYEENETDTLALKRNEETFDLEETEGDLKKENYLSEEEQALSKKKEFDELEALFAEAKKREAQQAEDLGGHYKGKINTTNLDLEEDEINDKKEYDNSELYDREKQVELELADGEPEEKRSRNQSEEEDDDDQESHKREMENIDPNMMSDNGSTDKINNLMMSEFGEDRSKKISTQNAYEMDTNKKRGTEDNEDDDDLKKKRNQDQLESEDDDIKDRKKDIYEKDEEFNRKKQLELDLEDSKASRRSTILDAEDAENDDEFSSTKSTNIQLLDGENERSKSSIDNEDDNMSFKKINQFDLDLDTSKKRNSNNGKVDKIDTFYRGGESKKAEHSWENLVDKTKSENLEVEKSARRNEESEISMARKNAGEITIDYRKLKEEFEYIAKNGSSEDDISATKRISGLNDSEDEGTFKVVEVDARGFEFGIEILNLIYQKDSKPVDFYKTVSEELISQYKAYPIFYTYKSSDKKHTEAFDSFIHFGDSLVSMELKDWWINTKTQQDILDDYFSKTMNTWLCRDISNKSGNGNYWEDVELPSWATNELSDKKVEMIFPYFDGVDRMGCAVLIFPTGVNPAKEKSIMVTLEMVRTILLESIQRKASSIDNLKDEEEPTTDKKNIINMFSGLFSRNKAS